MVAVCIGGLLLRLRSCARHRRGIIADRCGPPAGRPGRPGAAWPSAAVGRGRGAVLPWI